MTQPSRRPGQSPETLHLYPIEDENFQVRSMKDYRKLIIALATLTRRYERDHPDQDLWVVYPVNEDVDRA